MNIDLISYSAIFDAIERSLLEQGFSLVYKLPPHSGGAYHYRIYDKNGEQYKLTFDYSTIELEPFYEKNI